VAVQFVDEVKIHIASGNGGDGCLAFLREKFRPKGGPSGGDGGNGGDVVFIADRNLSTLLDYRFQRHHRAPHGEPGRGKNQHGAQGEDCEIRVPVGTLVKDTETGEVLADLTRDGQRWVGAPGGKGGRGNARFATSTNQAPRTFEKGTPGVERDVTLELKLLADVGLVGYPNAGKSTLISRMSAARPKIADYPFTTRRPVLGVVRYGEDGYVVADIPGLIEGAHEGTGLGHQFLRHAERTRLFLHVLDMADDTAGGPLDRFEVVEAELAAYNEDLAQRPRIVVLNKLDVTEARDRVPAVTQALEDQGLQVVSISAVTGEGVEQLIQLVGDKLANIGGSGT
jgi:GTP-binding protein